MRHSVASLGFLLLLALVVPVRAGPEEGKDGLSPAPTEAVPDATAKEALARFEQDFDTRDAAAKAAALEKLGGVPHPDVAARLLKELAHTHEPAVQQAALAALSGQGPSADRVGPAIVKFVLYRAAEVRERMKKGDPGFLLDRQSGDPDTKSAEGKKALADLAAQDETTAAAVRCLLRLDYHKHLDATSITPFLQSAQDDLVVLSLDAIARYEMWKGLPDVLFLYRMYPRENRWETGAIVDVAGSGTDATAKARWMLYFGHPAKQVPRPRVVQAIKACVKTLTGEEVEDPADLEALLRRADIKKKVQGSGHHH